MAENRVSDSSETSFGTLTGSAMQWAEYVGCVMFFSRSELISWGEHQSQRRNDGLTHLHCLQGISYKGVKEVCLLPTCMAIPMNGYILKGIRTTISTVSYPVYLLENKTKHTTFNHRKAKRPTKPTGPKGRTLLRRQLNLMPYFVRCACCGR